MLHAMPATTERRQTIRELLQQGDVRSQAELMDLLEKKGFQTSQPMVSRDLRALRVAKQEGAYHVVDEERYTPLESLKSLLRSTATATSFVLVRCEPGAASAVARALEAEDIPGVVGTVAGDDTAIVAVSSQAAGADVRRRVAALL
jgi:transcriptional regulator of arginine metabolism